MGKEKFKERANINSINQSRLAFHTDQGATDLIALLSLTAAPEGGESKWVSAIAIHNELLRIGRKVCVLFWVIQEPQNHHALHH